MKDKLKLSIVIPVYEEDKNLPVLAERLHAVVQTIRCVPEVILVDDGSPDQTWSSICKACQQFPYMVGYRLSRNFGHQNALLAGLHMASGDVVISMDGDLQHPPNVIPRLVSEWQQGFQVVHTKRKDQKVTSVFKRLTSRYFYKVFAALTDVGLPEGTSDFRLLDRTALDLLLNFKDGDLFLRGAVHWIGFRATTVSFDVEERHAGDSKYDLRRMLRFAAGAVVSYSTKPLFTAIWIGIATGAFAFLELIYIVYQFSLGRTVPGWASTVGILSLLFGVLFLLLGIMGAYLAAVHKMLQRRPQFIIAESHGGQQEVGPSQRSGH